MDKKKFTQKMSTKSHPKMSTKCHPKRGLLVDKSVHEMSPKVSTRCHLFCPRDVTYYVHEMSATPFFPTFRFAWHGSSKAPKILLGGNHLRNSTTGITLVHFKPSFKSKHIMTQNFTLHLTLSLFIECIYRRSFGWKYYSQLLSTYEKNAHRPF